MKSGLYEQVVNNLIRKELDERDEKEYSLSNMEKNSAPKVLSRYIESVVETLWKGRRIFLSRLNAPIESSQR